MGGMDYSDVDYDAFLINGRRSLPLAEAHPGIPAIQRKKLSKRFSASPIPSRPNPTRMWGRSYS